LLLPIISSFASHAVLPLFRFVEEHTTLSDSNLDGAGWALTSQVVQLSGPTALYSLELAALTHQKFVRYHLQ